MVGVVGLVFFPSPGLRSLGIGGALVVFFSVAASVTFMPALLGVLGHRVDWLPVIRLHEAREGKLWRWWASVLVKRPWAAIIVAVVLIALLAAPATTMKTQMSGATTLPPSAESRQGLEILDTQFDRTALSPISVLLTWEGDGTDRHAPGGRPLHLRPAAASRRRAWRRCSAPSRCAGWAATRRRWPRSGRSSSKLLNDPDNFVIPAEGITLDGGQTITAAQLEQFKQLIKSSVAPGAILFQVTATGAPNSTADAGPRQDPHHHRRSGRLPGARGGRSGLHATTSSTS